MVPKWVPVATATALLVTTVTSAVVSTAVLVAVRAATSLVVYALLWLMLAWLDFDFRTIYVLFGGCCVLLALFMWRFFPHFESPVPQRRRLLLRGRYWLYYALTFVTGARRQIFVVFAGFLLVEKFAFDVRGIAALFLVNGALSMLLASQVGRLVAHWGERRALIFEYAGLILVFSGYALVESGAVAAGLYIGVPLGALAAVHASAGPEAVLLLIGTVVVSDSSQYYTGRLLGRHLLAPAVSPKKTIEGAVGGLVFGTAAMVVGGGLVLPSVGRPALAAAASCSSTRPASGCLPSGWSRSSGVPESRRLRAQAQSSAAAATGRQLLGARAMEAS